MSLTGQKQVANYTQKTQYLFRISNNYLNLSNGGSVNLEMDNEDRRIPFKNIVYIGDSETNIPAMKVVENQEGSSIDVYNTFNKRIDKVIKLVEDDKKNFPADYNENSY